jgi:hypothetical protein
MNKKRYKEVLNQLDDQARFDKMGFPAFGAGAYYVDSRMSVFADEEHWGILIEVIEDSGGGIGHPCYLNSAYRFGNYLSRPLGLEENKAFLLTSDGDDGPLFAENHGYLNPDVQTMRLRGHLVVIPRDTRFYESKGIKLVDKNKINSRAVLNAIGKGTIIVNKDEIWPLDLLRALTPEYREYFFLTEEEKQKEFMEPIPLLLQLEQWRHPLYDESNILEPPSKCETFQLIAKVISTCNPNEYKPTEKPNTHWKNWLIADVYL